jgi:hypothetical protein
MSIEDQLERIASLLAKIAENTGSPAHAVADPAAAPKRGPGRPPKAAPVEPEPTDETPAEDEATPEAEDVPVDEAPADEPEPPKAKGKATATTPTKAQAQAIVENRVACKMKFKALLGEPGGRAKAQEILKWLKVEVISAVPDAKLDAAIGAIKRALAGGAKASAAK